MRSGTSTTNGHGGSRSDRCAREPRGRDAEESLLAPLLEQLAQLRADLKLYAQLCVDESRVRLRGVLVGIVGVLLAAIVGSGLLVTAAVLVLTGAAEGLAALLGAPLWLGRLLAGGGVLIVTFAGLYLSGKRLETAAQRKLVEKYEHVPEPCPDAVDHPGAPVGE